MFRAAWKAVGKHCSRPGEIGETTHELDLAISMAQCAEKLQSREIVDQFLVPVEQGLIKTGCLARHHDATPALVQFGPLQGHILIVVG